MMPLVASFLQIFLKAASPPFIMEGLGNPKMATEECWKFLRTPRSRTHRNIALSSDFEHYCLQYSYLVSWEKCMCLMCIQILRWQIHNLQTQKKKNVRKKRKCSNVLGLSQNNKWLLCHQLHRQSRWSKSTFWEHDWSFMWYLLEQKVLELQSFVPIWRLGVLPFAWRILLLFLNA